MRKPRRRAAVVRLRSPRWVMRRAVVALGRAGTMPRWVMRRPAAALPSSESDHRVGTGRAMEREGKRWDRPRDGRGREALGPTARWKRKVRGRGRGREEEGGEESNRVEEEGESAALKSAARGRGPLCSCVVGGRGSVGLDALQWGKRKRGMPAASRSPRCSGGRGSVGCQPLAALGMDWEWSSGELETAGRRRVGRGMDWVTGTWTRTGYAVI